MLGCISESTDDRIQCLAMELGVSREELVGRALGIGLTVLEVSTEIPESRLWVWDGKTNGRRIDLSE